MRSRIVTTILILVCFLSYIGFAPASRAQANLEKSSASVQSKSPGVTVAPNGSVTMKFTHPSDLLKEPYEYCWLENSLPSLFTRSFQVKNVQLRNATAELLFAGMRGGVRVLFAPEGITVRHEDTDGQGYPMSGRVHTNERSFGTVPAPALPYKVRVIVTHDHNLVLTINDQPVLRIGTFHDFFGVAAFIRPVNATSLAEGELQFAPVAEEKTTATVRLLPQQQHQTMLGWGGITSIPSYHDLSAAQQSAYRDALFENNLLLVREYPASDYLNPTNDNWDSSSAARVHYNDSEDQGEISDFNFLKEMKRRGAITVTEFWRHPPHHYVRDAAGKLTVQADLPAIARSLVRYCQIYRERTGFQPDIIGVQNEPDVAHSVAPGFLPPTRAAELTRELRIQLDAAGFNRTQIHSANAGQLRNGLQWLDAINADPPARSMTNYFASNVYDYNAFAPDRFDVTLQTMRQKLGGMPFLAIEIGNNHGDKQAHSYRMALGYAQQMHKLLTIGDAVGVAYIWTLLKSTHQNFNWTRTLLYPNRANGNELEASFYWRIFTAYSRHIKRGMRRIGVESSHPDLLVTAYDDGRGGLTMVIINRASADMEVRFDNVKAKTLSREIVSHTQPNISAGDVKSLSAGFAEIIPGGSIVTYSNVALNK